MPAWAVAAAVTLRHVLLLASTLGLDPATVILLPAPVPGSAANPGNLFDGERSEIELFLRTGSAQEKLLRPDPAKLSSIAKLVLPVQTGFSFTKEQEVELVVSEPRLMSPLSECWVQWLFVVFGNLQELPGSRQEPGGRQLLSVVMDSGREKGSDMAAGWRDCGISM